MGVIKMGMYTELVLSVELEKEMTEEKLEALMGQCGVGVSGSYYFPLNSKKSFYTDHFGYNFFSIRTNLKNYDSQIQKFIKKLAPFIVRGGGCNDYIGHILYEEDSVPTLLFLKKSRKTGKRKVIEL
jgi:hypothetical protein